MLASAISQSYSFSNSASRFGFWALETPKKKLSYSLFRFFRQKSYFRSPSSNRAEFLCGGQYNYVDQLWYITSYRNSDFFINDFFKKPLFRQLFSGGIRVRTLYRQKTREIERVMILRICHGILTSFFYEYIDDLNCNCNLKSADFSSNSWLENRLISAWILG